PTCRSSSSPTRAQRDSCRSDDFCVEASVEAPPKLAAKGVPARWFQRACSVARAGEQDGALAGDFADSGERDVGEFGRQSTGVARGDGEQQFVVVTAVEGQRQSVKLAPAASATEISTVHFGNDDFGDFRGVDDGADLARGAKSGKVGG